LRVVYVSLFADFVGGGEYSLFDLMSHLPPEIEPVLITPAEGALTEHAKQEGIVWHIAPMPKLGVVSLKALWRWRELLVKIKPDVLHANNSRAAFYAGLAGKITGTPMLFHCRIPERDPRLDRWLVRLAVGVIVNSRATAERFAGCSDMKLWTVLNGVDVSVWRMPQQDKKPFHADQIMLIAARVSRCKRHDIGLDVFNQLADKFPGLHLVCAGGVHPMDRAWWNEMQQRTRDSGKENRIHWLGDVTQHDLGGWYALADVLLLPSDYESFGRVLVEAMAAGVTPIAFAVGGVPEVVQHGKQGILVPQGDVDGMAAAVAKLFGDAEMCAAMGEAGRLRAREFSVARHVEKICAVYAELAK